MALKPTRLAQFQPAVAETTYFTASAAALYVIVTNIIVANTAATGIALSLSIVPVGSIAGTANRLIPNVNIPAYTVVPFDLATVMNPGDFISTAAATGASLVVTISGVVAT
jgi:hypothetical protein